MTHNSMNRRILRLAIPNIISNLTVPMLSFVDTALMGHLGDPAYIGAIAIGGMIFNFVFWGFGFLRMGTTGFTAQALGKHRLDESFFVLARALSVAGTGAFLLIIFQYPIAELSFYLVKASDEVERLARTYFYIRIYAAPATIASYALLGWFLGMQNATVPMLISIVVNVANVVFNLWFVQYLGMTSDGVAWGTVIAQYIGLVITLGIFLAYNRKLLKYWLPEAIYQKQALLQFFQVNNDILLRTLALLFAFSFFYAESATYGDVLLAVNSVLLQFNVMLAFGVDGFAYAAESLVGKYVGAHDPRLLRKAIRYLFAWGMGLAVIFTLGYGLGYEAILYVLTDQQEVIERSQPFVIWILLAPLVNSVCFIWDGIYIGATASKAMRNSTFIATFLVFLPTYYLTESYLGNHALWLAMTLFMVTRGIALSWLAPKYIYRLVER